MEILSPKIKIETHREAAECKADITPPSLHTKYTFIREIGHGTQGRIYLAKRNEDSTLVAIKQLNIESLKTWKEYDLFRREASVLESLDIPGIATFYEAIECLEDEPPCSYIVQEYICGQPLASMIKAGHRFTLNRIYDIILQILEILDLLQKHDPPIVHRDIKPSNIMLRPLGGDDFKVYLIDFGAVANPQIQSGGSTVAGTFGYMAPEQMMGKPEPASDIYSLGAVAVHLISGKSPAEMPVKDFHLIFEPYMQNMPPVLVATLRRMLAPNVAERLCDIDVLSKLFEAFSESIYNTQEHFGSESISSEEYGTRLKQVEYYGQDGNIELWQRLPDETPREMPKEVRSQTFNLENEKYVFPIVQTHKKFPNRTLREIIPIIFYIFMFASFILGFHFYTKSLDSEELKEFKTFDNHYSSSQNIDLDLPVTFTIIGIIIMMIGTIYFNTDRFQYPGYRIITKKIKDSSFQFTIYKSPENLFSTKDFNFIKTATSILLQEGRKTIATITDIKYLNTLGQNVETQYLKKDNSSHYICHGSPSFCIKYAFNPPDDTRSENIIHTIITHTDAFTHLKIGDPLPILYHIIKHKGREDVISMPFPYPLMDPITSTDIYSGDSVPLTHRLIHRKNQPSSIEINAPDFSIKNNAPDSSIEINYPSERARICSSLTQKRADKACLYDKQRNHDGFMIPAPSADSASHTKSSHSYSAKKPSSNELNDLFNQVLK